jgi:glycine oxidase
MERRTVVVGGGIIGLSIAFELSSRGEAVTLVERNQFAGQASWAGAGMLPPANRATAVHPMEHLEAISNQLHPEWSRRLQAMTNIETGYRKCGGMYLARTAGEIASLTGALLEWDDRSIEFERLDLKLDSDRLKLLPFVDLSDVKMAVSVPVAAQFHNPNHNRALVAACEMNGVRLLDDQGEVSVETEGQAVGCVRGRDVAIQGDQFVFCAGAWSEKLLNQLSVSLPMQPVRGQIALYQLPPKASENWKRAPIINEGSRYLVARQDGFVLAGATIEEVGFDCQSTPGEVADLRAWAEGLSNDLNPATFDKSWAGLRPGTFDGYPYLGKLPEWENVIVATGHFKAGLQLSTGTAEVIADLIQAKEPQINLTPFRPARVIG